MKLLKLLKSITVFTFLISWSFTHAQITSSLNISPVNPSPYDEVTVVFTSYSFDMDLATYTWYVNREKISSGIGQRQIKLNAGKGGERKLIEVEVLTPNGELVPGQIIISPQSIAISYEAVDSYVPAGYLGRPVPGEGSVVKITVNPTFFENGVLLDKNNITYTWTVNDEYRGNLSGYGKHTNSIILDELYGEYKINVIARSPKGGAAEKTITIKPNPIITYFYKKDPLYGVSINKAYTGRIEIKEDTSVIFIPYFLSDRFTDDAIFTWSLDGLPITPSTPDSVLFSPKENSFGSRILNISISNITRVLQKVDASLEVVFDTR